MWLAFYNKSGIGDVLLLTRGPLEHHLAQATSYDSVTVICNKATNDIISVNIFEVSDLKITEQGEVKLSPAQLLQVNARLQQAGVNLEIEVDTTPKFVVGYVEECLDHADSDHLHVTKTRVSDDEVLQIVCGASNIAQGQSVIVAKIGAVMPSGMMIWDGELRGVPSHGMICSTRELNLTHIEDKPGIWVLPNGFEVGTPLSEVVATQS